MTQLFAMASQPLSLPNYDYYDCASHSSKPAIHSGRYIPRDRGAIEEWFIISLFSCFHLFLSHGFFFERISSLFKLSLFASPFLPHSDLC